MSTPESDTPPFRLDRISTDWNEFRDAHDASSKRNAQARKALVARYAKAIHRYVTAIVKNPADADDLGQEVLVRLLRGDFAGADPNRGRFRDLLKTAVRNMVHNHWERSNRQQTAKADLEEIPSISDDDDSKWALEFRRDVVENAWGELKKLELENPTNPAYTLLKLRSEFPDCTSEVLAQKLGVKLGASVRADACRQMLRRARMRLAEALVVEIGFGLANLSAESIADELAAIGLLDHVKDFLPKDQTAWDVLIGELSCQRLPS